MSCPICQRASDDKYRPFCSRRCSDVDLGKWLTGAYRVAATELEQDETSSDHPAEDPSNRTN
jgi:endogenous inhibitor of DNA gyrase (YacG/DUF329 family)